MNERIKELAEQAGADFMRRINYNNLEGKEYEEDAGVIFESNELFEKFAELIVQECSKTVNDTEYPYEDPAHKETWDACCVWSAEKLKEHFGVEE